MKKTLPIGQVVKLIDGRDEIQVPIDDDFGTILGYDQDPKLLYQVGFNSGPIVWCSPDWLRPISKDQRFLSLWWEGREYELSTNEMGYIDLLGMLEQLGEDGRVIVRGLLASNFNRDEYIG